ncbi:DUF5819 family protein [Aeromicrobium sp. P5_D10]
MTSNVWPRTAARGTVSASGDAETAKVDTVSGVPRVTKRSAFVAVAGLLAAAHLFAVTFNALPPNQYSEIVTPHTGYLQPYFAQNWRLFAPSPVSEDRELLLQGSYLDADGTAQRTPWINWTQVELDLIHHRLVGGRAGYVSNKLFGPLSQRYRAIGTAQKALADATSQTDPLDWSELREQLTADGADPARIATFLTYEQATSRLATDVVMGRWPERTFTAVRYQLRSRGVVPYASRQASAANREAARPLAVERTSGWRVPAPGGADERRAVAEFDRRHR